MTREELVVRVTDHLRHTPIAATPAFEAAGWPWSAHGPGSGPGGHGYDGACALCRTASSSSAEVLVARRSALDAR